MPYNRILIAVDHSSYSMKAAKAGFALAHDLKATVTLLCVVDKLKEQVNADLGITLEQTEADLQREAEQTLEEYIRLYDEVNIVKRLTPEGLPGREIIRTAASGQADLIVMGSHGRSGIRKLLMGSTAEYVLRHATVPVLVVPAGAE
ncbi:MAG TPA: universal stress protein [Puia sp.]|nr:universal stress protein [Puia sp.]